METYEIVTYDQQPSQDAWSFPILYRKDANGRDSFWQIGFDGINKLTMNFGKVNGKPRLTQTLVTPKSNRNMQEQALLEARHRYQDKIKKDGYQDESNYHFEGEEKREENNNNNKKREKRELSSLGPMLAKTWFPEKTKIKYPIATQPKLDGIRCLVHLDNDDDNIVVLRSRNGNFYSFLDNLRQELKLFLDCFPKGTILDGELFDVGLDFSIITSIVRRTVTRHPDEDLLKYYVYDLILPDNPNYQDRLSLLEKSYSTFKKKNKSKYLKLVETRKARHKDDLFRHHEKYINDNYEGLIIRNYSAKYEMKRTSNLLKYKNFQEEEGEVIDVQEALGTEEGAAILIILDPRGNKVPVRFIGSIERRREWVKNPNLVLGKLATVSFQELSKDGIWRFPVGKDIRDYE